MGVYRTPHPTDDSTMVELLDNAAPVADEPGRRWSTWYSTTVVGVVVLLYLGLLAVPTEEETTEARLHPVGVHFGDPFDIEWVELHSPADRIASWSSLVPMAGVEPPCVGFGRPDWPSDRRHPSVARCIDATNLDQLDSEDMVGIWQIVAGTETWHFLFFEIEVVELEMRIGGSLESDRVYLEGRFAAILVPTGAADVALTWRLRTGGPYACHLDRTSGGPLTCA